MTVNLIRLNKFLSSSGAAARRKADILISEGRVSVNSRLVMELGVKIDPENDVVKVDGELIKNKSVDSKHVYILLNKPPGYITTTSDEKNRPTVMDLVKIHKRIYPVGRLDYDSEGLLLLTDDGELANKLMHPKYEINKTYFVKINKPIDANQEKRLRDGVVIERKNYPSSQIRRKVTSNKVKTSKANVEVMPESNKMRLIITIHEGRNREIRKMLEAVGLFVRTLKRIEYANLNIKGLKSGDWRYITEVEIRDLKTLISSGKTNK